MANRKEERKAKQAARAAKTGTTTPPAAPVTVGAKQPKSSTPAELKRAALALDAIGQHDAARALLDSIPTTAKRESKPKPEPRPTCTGTKKNGDACTAKAKEGSDKCVDHQAAYARLDAEEQANFAEWMNAQTVEQLAEELGWYRAKQLAKAHKDGAE